MKRGDIYFVGLDPTIGGETQKTRPSIIISNNANNAGAPTITIIPITSNVKNVYPFEVLLNEKSFGLSKPSKALCNQVRTISKLRVNGNKIGSLDANTMIKVELALKLHLGLK